MSTNSSLSVNTKAEAEEPKLNSKPLSALTEEEASEWLRSLGEEPRVKWTSVEIKSRIKEILDHPWWRVGDNSKNTYEHDPEFAEIPWWMQRADYDPEEVQKCVEDFPRMLFEAKVPGVPWERRRDNLPLPEDCTSRSIMGFGEFSDLTYEEVAEDQPAYVKWARETVQDGGEASHWRLRKFVARLNHEATASRASSSATASVARSKGRCMAATGKDADDMMAETRLMEENSKLTNQVEEENPGVLEELDQRRTSLEMKQTQLEKPYDGTASESRQSQPLDGDAEK